MKQILVLSMLFFTTYTYAAWREIGQHTTETTEKIYVNIEKNGSYTYEKEKTIKPLELESLEESKVILHSFDEDSQTLELLWVKVCPNGKKKSNCRGQDVKKVVYEIGEKEAIGFSSEKRLKYVVDNFRLGDTLIYKYRRNIKLPPIKNHFSGKYYFGYETLEKGSELIINSKIKLEYIINNLENFKVLKKSNYNLHLRQERALYKSYHNYSDEEVYERDSEYSYVQISSFSNWEDLRFEEAKLFTETSFPKVLKDIANQVKNKKSLEEKLKFLSIWIIENFTYFGDWKRVNGGLRPRALEKIVNSKYGDCKDLSHLMSSILTNAGVDASVALVYRGDEPQTDDFSMPSSNYFNHAIVQVYEKGKRLWLDPTNKYFGYNIIPEDIAGKNSLVLFGKGKGLVKTDYHESTISSNKTIATYKKVGNVFKIQTQQTLYGNANSPLATIIKDKGPEEIKTLLKNYRLESDNEDITKMELTLGEPYICDKKIINFNSKQEKVFEYTTQNGELYTIHDTVSGLLQLIYDNPRLVTRLGNYGKIEYHYTFKDYQLKDQDKFECVVRSKWMDKSVNVINKKDSVIYKGNITIKEIFISLDDNRSELLFKSFVENYKKCFYKRGLILNKLQ